MRFSWHDLKKIIMAHDLNKIIMAANSLCGKKTVAGSRQCGGGNDNETYQSWWPQIGLIKSGWLVWTSGIDFPKLNLPRSIAVGGSSASLFCGFWSSTLCRILNFAVKFKQLDLQPPARFIVFDLVHVCFKVSCLKTCRLATLCDTVCQQKYAKSYLHLSNQRHWWQLWARSPKSISASEKLHGKRRTVSPFRCPCGRRATLETMNQR